MKKYFISFTTIFLALSAMPGFVQAANPSALDQLNALGPGLTKKAEETSKKIIEKQGSKGTALKRKGMACTNAKEHQLLATYESDGGPCVVKSCVVGYKLENGACVKKAKKGETETGETDGTTPEAETEGSEEETTAAEGTQNRSEEAKQKYEDAKANEQSTANKTLTAATTAATGIGTMELLQGRAEQKADKEAAESMAAYIATMRCTYGEDKQVKAGPDEIELPGGNNQDLMNYRAEYLALANDLKERKTALGMKPGIESEELIDKASTGLYDDENLGITSGAYASLYRAQMLGSETDQAKIDEAAKTSKNRVLGGAIAAGAGLVIGVAGNALINGELGKKLKEAIQSKKNGEAMKKFVKEEENELKKLKDCLKQADIKNTDKLTLETINPFYPSLFSFDKLSCKEDLKNTTVKDAVDLFKLKDSEETTNEQIIEKMVTNFGAGTTGKLLGVTISDPMKDTERTNAANVLEERAKAIQSRYEEANQKDESNSGGSILGNSGALGSLIQQ